MKLETERLILVPLTLNNLKQALEDRSEMARVLNLYHDIEDLDDMMINVYMKKISNIEKDPANYIFYTYWQLVLKHDNKIIGEIGYKGMPDDHGRIEVGYSTDVDYQCNGYMTEALNELIRWTYSQNQVTVKSIVASTLKDNIPSHKVLKKVGAMNYKETDQLLWWKIENPEIS